MSAAKCKLSVSRTVYVAKSITTEDTALNRNIGYVTLVSYCSVISLYAVDNGLYTRPKLTAISCHQFYYIRIYVLMLKINLQAINSTVSCMDALLVSDVV